MHYWDNGWHMGWMWIGWLLVAVVIALLLRAVLVQGKRGGASRDSPERILKRRYAKGEIDRETYERMLEDLRK